MSDRVALPVTPRITLHGATLRANPAYTLVPFDRLPDAEQEMFAHLCQDPTFYGLLCPRVPSALSIKAIDRETALLFMTLTEPGPMPTYLQHVFGADTDQAIAELVINDVLELEQNGVFVSGVRSYRLLAGPSAVAVSRSVLAQRSMDALQYAQALPITSQPQLALRLYCYGRLPLTPRLSQQFPSSSAVVDYLGIRAGEALAALLNTRWFPVPTVTSEDAWLAWRSRRAPDGHAETAGTYKLYVSPSLSALPDAFATTISVITRDPVPHFKVGRDIRGLLRPDKLVMYFSSRDDLLEVAERLRARLDGCPAHGVPFTATIAGAGLLSWGADPPPDRSRGEPHNTQSWRQWVTNRLATALLAAKAAPTPELEPWQVAMDRLSLDGVDTTTWAPTTGLWTRLLRNTP